MATSSGSTGVPTVSPFTQEDFDLWQDTEARLFWQAGMRPNDRYVHGLNFALYVGGPDVIGAQRLGALAIWVGAVPSDRLLFVLKQYQPTVIWTSPSYAWHLGEIAKEKGFNPREDFSIHTIIVRSHREVFHLLQQSLVPFIELDVMVLYIRLHRLYTHCLIAGLRYLLDRKV